MTPGARIQAAIEILGELIGDRTPADDAIRTWGRAHRFAGAKDRASVRESVFLAMRHRGGAARLMGDDSARALMLGSLKLGLGWSTRDFSMVLGQGKYDAGALRPNERESLDRAFQEEAADNWPHWLAEKIKAQNSLRGAALLAALLEIAPLDLRVNALNARRESVVSALMAVGFSAEATEYSPWGIRIARANGLGGTNIRALPMFHQGQVEIQDEGSQLAALASGATPRETAIDLCAGGGGKTLVLAAMMKNAGRIIACDIDAARLRAGAERVRRARIDCVEHKELSDWAPEQGGSDPQLDTYRSAADLVFLDVPCSGSGAWRRQPEAKWRLTPEDLSEFCAVQRRLLARGARLVKPGGRLAYVTCSVFAEENEHQVAEFLDTTEFRPYVDPRLEAALAHLPVECWHRENRATAMLQTLPVTTRTDGFFVAVLEKPL